MIRKFNHILSKAEARISNKCNKPVELIVVFDYEKDDQKPVTCEILLEMVCHKYEIDREDIEGERVNPILSKARASYISLASKYSYNKICKVINLIFRDNSSYYSLLKKHRVEYLKNKVYRVLYLSMENQILVENYGM